MNINVELLENLSADDIACIDDLKELLQKATTYADAISKYYSFKIGEIKKTVWSDSNNAEYLTIEGEWQARYLHQTYNVKCDRDSIFNVLKEKYLVSHKLINMGTKVNNKADSAGYFESFAQNVIKKIESEG